MSAWETIFAQSPVNDGDYDEEKLPYVNWHWPRETWFQSRLGFVREHEPTVSLKSLRKLRRRGDPRLN